jgi:hypothetical protein
LVDESRHKRILTGIAALAVSSGAVGIALIPGFMGQSAIQVVIGLGVTVPGRYRCFRARVGGPG